MDLAFVDERTLERRAAVALLQRQVHPTPLQALEAENAKSLHSVRVVAPGRHHAE